MERYGQLTIKVGDTSFEMILVQGYEGGDFYIGKYPVTQAQWKAIMGDNPSHFQGDDLPVESVKWDQAKEFADKLILMTDKFFRLPEEKEWEYAAKGGNRSQGYKYSGSNVAHKVAWYDANSAGRTHPVGKKEPNELGIYDMSGNVWEWSNTTYEFASDEKVIRGGAYNNDCCLSSRDYKYNNFGLINLGFRLALSV
ncbi:MAG: SUMF1/EgtB/PvdO family nonheme iron enzyme [Bacteroidales bacterium]|nr:SUMF1/EgtB/PvdO family nonheme iron enzyme [Bacteroidales bacterium]